VRGEKEVCDDGSNDGIGCLVGCGGSVPGYGCTNGLNIASVCGPDPGDGTVIASEECDDGNTVSNDGCSSTMIKEVGWTFSVTAPTVCTEIPDDGMIVGNE
jgi:cysteine-rich repeat protein